MLLAIHFHDEAGLVAVEVGDVGAAGVLAAELEALGALAEGLPELDFGRRQGSPEPTSWCDGLRITG
jgi:hypothetical protein